MSKTIVFFGTDEFSAVSLKALIDADYSVAAVVTKPDSHKGRGGKLTKPLVKEIAEKNGIEVWQPEKLSQIIGKVHALNEPVGVLVSYGKIIPQTIIDLFNPGIINVHPSLLPLYRGPSPIEAAILHGDTETGVSIMQITTKMDAGPVYSQVMYDLTGEETAPELELKLAELGASELIRTLPDIIDGSLSPVAQIEADASHCPLLQKSDGLLNPATLEAAEAERRVRAFLSFPKTKMTVLGHQVIITKSHVSHETKSALDFLCSDGKYFCIDELIGPSGRTMTGEAFLNGYA